MLLAGVTLIIDSRLPAIVNAPPPVRTRAPHASACQLFAVSVVSNIVLTLSTIVKLLPGSTVMVLLPASTRFQFSDDVKARLLKWRSLLATTTTLPPVTETGPPTESSTMVVAVG